MPVHTVLETFSKHIRTLKKKQFLFFKFFFNGFGFKIQRIKKRLKCLPLILDSHLAMTVTCVLSLLSETVYVYTWMGQEWPQVGGLGEGDGYTGNNYTIFCLYFCMFEILHIFKKFLVHAKKIVYSNKLK